MILRPDQIRSNVFQLIGADWMLITAGKIDSFNMMTASWGGFGYLWNRNVCYCYIRPSRFTYGLMEKGRNFTLCFFEEVYRDKLDLCGSYSGKNTDKVQMTGFTPVESEAGSVYFNEARMVLFCRKLYFQDVEPDNFIEPGISDHYKAGDYHRMYIGEIQGCLAR